MLVSSSLFQALGGDDRAGGRRTGSGTVEMIEKAGGRRASQSIASYKCFKNRSLAVRSNRNN